MPTPSNKKNATGPAVERRRASRRPVLETFSLYAVVPKKGVHRLLIQDVSELGIGFYLDIEGEDRDVFDLQAGEELDLRLYVNQTLYLPLRVAVARLEDHGSTRKVGAEFRDLESKTYRAWIAFLQMLDLLSEAGRVGGPNT